MALHDNAHSVHFNVGAYSPDSIGVMALIPQCQQEFPKPNTITCPCVRSCVSIGLTLAFCFLSNDASTTTGIVGGFFVVSTAHNRVAPIRATLQRFFVSLRRSGGVFLLDDRLKNLQLVDSNVGGCRAVLLRLGLHF